jgi:serine/threonine-protein kinase
VKKKKHAGERANTPAAGASSAAGAGTPASGPLPSPGSLAGLVVLGAATALWSVFLWGELLLARAGGTAVCALGGGAECSALWDGPFANSVHRLSGVPVAGWGLVWGLAAFALPLAALWRAAERRLESAFVSAVRLTAGAGVVAVLVFLGVAVSARTLCLACFFTYVLVAGYAGIALYGWQVMGLGEARRGALLAAGTTVAAYLLVLYPGLRTPRGASEAGRQAIASSPPHGAAASAGTAPRDGVTEFVESLSPELKQTLSDSLHIYRSSPPAPPPPPRSLLGPQGAPVRITEFTDVLCDHCAELHETVKSLREHAAPGSFSVDARQFPLDGACNPMLQARGGESVRCVAAKARICLEGENGFAYAGALFESQKTLTVDKVYELAAPYMARPALEACIASSATRGKLEADVAAASRYEPDGTPIVVVNGRRGTSFGPFLYAMVLTAGSSAHPAFEGLPAPNPRAHLH